MPTILEVGKLQTSNSEFPISEWLHCSTVTLYSTNKSRWAVVSPLRPRGRAAEKYHGGALALDESRAVEGPGERGESGALSSQTQLQTSVRSGTKVASCRFGRPGRESREI